MSEAISGPDLVARNPHIAALMRAATAASQRQRLPRLVDIGCGDVRHAVTKEAVDEIRHRGKFIVAMAARERRHEGVLDWQRRVRAGEQDRHQIGGVGIVDGAAAQVGVRRLHALAVPIAAIGAIAREDLDAEARSGRRFVRRRRVLRDGGRIADRRDAARCRYRRSGSRRLPASRA